jgi:hypothetical protein
MIAASGATGMVPSFERLNYLFARYSDLSASRKEDGAQTMARKMT